MMELLWANYVFDGRCEHEQSVFEPVPPGCALFLSKKPADTKRIAGVFRADPSLHVLAMLRDPRGVICSRHPRRPDDYFSDYGRWRAHLSAIAALGDHPRLLWVRYEDLLARPDEVQEQIGRCFPFLRPRGRFSSFPREADVPELARRSLLGVRPLDTSRIDGWRDDLPRVAGELQQHPDMAQTLIDLDYEPDRTWTAQLTGVPVRRVDALRGPHLLRRLETAARYRWKTRRYLKRLQK